MKYLMRFGVAAAVLSSLAAFEMGNGVKAAGGPVEPANTGFQVLTPIKRGLRVPDRGRVRPLHAH